MFRYIISQRSIAAMRIGQIVPAANWRSVIALLERKGMSRREPLTGRGWQSCMHGIRSLDPAQALEAERENDSHLDLC